jgi:hypothetical protein
MRVNLTFEEWNKEWNNFKGFIPVWISYEDDELTIECIYNSRLMDGPSKSVRFLTIDNPTKEQVLVIQKNIKDAGGYWKDTMEGQAERIFDYNK